MTLERGGPLRLVVEPDASGRMAAALALSSDLVTCIDADARVTFWNRGCERLYGWRAEEVLGQPLESFVAPDARDQLHAVLRALRSGQDVPALEMARRTKDGRRVRVSLRVSPLLDGEGRYAGALAVGRDVPLDLVQRQERAQAPAQHATALREDARRRSVGLGSTDVGLLADRDGTLTYVTDSVMPQLGYRPDEVVGRPVGELFDPEDADVLSAAWENAVADASGRPAVRVRARHRDGHRIWVEQTVMNHLDDDEVRAVVVNVRDISELMHLQARLHEHALYDELTGVANRTLLLDRATHALQRAAAKGQRIGLLCIGIDGLPTVNDRLGHPAGDEAVLAVAQLLGAGLDPGDTLARTGGDQFTVLVEEVEGEQELRQKASMMQALLSAGIGQRDENVELGISVGIAVRGSGQAETLVVAAQTALRAARSRGRGEVAAFSAFERRPARQDRDDVDDLRRGLDADEMVLHYQPIIDLRTGAAVAAEAVVRWRHPTRGLLAPADFLDLAERSGLIVPLGEVVLRKACAAAVGWPARDGVELGVVVNLSRRQVSDPDVVDLVIGAVREAGLQPERLSVDVAESTLADLTGPRTAGLTSLRELGVGICVDDFGAGESSLAYVRQFPVAALKIDGAFVAGLGTDADATAIVASVVRLAEAVGVASVAEAVETSRQQDVLRELGCDLGQGTRWCPPLPEDELLTWWGQQAGAPAAEPGPAPAARDAVPPRSRRHAVQVPKDVHDRILKMQAEGASLHTIAAALNAGDIASPAGIRWHSRSVARALAQPRQDPGS